MKKITDPSKLLPAAKSVAVTRGKKAEINPSSALVTRPKKDSAIVSSRKKSSALVRKENKGVEYVNVRMIAIENLFRNDFANVKKEAEEKRQKEEKQDFTEAEKKLETPKTKKLGLGGGGGDSPSIGFFDRVKRFLFFTALGWLLPKILEFLPKLQGVVKTIGTIYKFAEGLFGKLFDGFMTLVKFGGDLKKSTLGFIAGMKEGDYKTEFTKLEKTFDTFVNASIIAGVLAADIGFAAVDEFNKWRGKNKKLETEKAKPTKKGKEERSKVTQGRGGRAALGAASRVTQGKGGKAPGWWNRILRGPFAKLKGPLSKFAGAAVPGLGAVVGAADARARFAADDRIGGSLASVSAALDVATVASALTGVGLPVAAVLGSVSMGIDALLLIRDITKTFFPFIPMFSGGGRVVNAYQGGGTARTTRRPPPKPPKVKKPIKTKPPETRVGRDVGGENKVVQFYAKDTKDGKETTPIFGNFAAALNYFSGSPKNKEQNRPLNALKGVSKILKDLPFGLGYFAGGAIDIALGQSMDVKKGLSQLSSGIAYMVDTLANQRANMSMTGLIRDLNAFAEGGTIPATRTLANPYSSVSSSDLIAKVIGPTIEQKVNEAMQSIEKDLRSLQQQKKEEPPSPGPGPGEYGSAGGEYGGYAPQSGLQKEIYDYLTKEKKLSDVQALGLMANINRESSFIPGNIEPGGGRGHGLMQWSYERTAAMIRAVPDWKTNWRAQLDYALNEPYNMSLVKPGEYQSTRFSSAQEAADWWMRRFLRPADEVSGSRKHAEYLKGIPKALDGTAKFRVAEGPAPQMQGISTDKLIPHSGPGGFLQGSSGFGREDFPKYGVHFHLSPPNTTKDGLSRTRSVAFSAIKRMIARGSRVYLPNIKRHVPSDASDSQIQSLLVAEQRAHTAPGRTQGGIDIQELDTPNVGPTHRGLPGSKTAFPFAVGPVSQLSSGSGYGREAEVLGSGGVVLAHGASGSAATDRRIIDAEIAKRGRESQRAGERRQYDVIIPLDHHTGRLPDKSLWPNASLGAAGRERQAQNPTAELMRQRLEAKGLRVKILRPEDYRTEREYNAALVRFSKAGAVVSALHYDAPRSQGGVGFLARLGSSPDKADRDFANKLAPVLQRMAAASRGDQIYGGIDTAGNITMSKAGPATAALIELGSLVEQEKRYGKQFWKNPEFIKHLDALANVTASSVQRDQTPPRNTAQRQASPQGQGQITTRPQLGSAITNLRPGQTLTIPGVGRVSRDKNGNPVYIVDGKGQVAPMKFFAAFDAKNKPSNPPKMQQGGIIKPRGTQLPIPNSYAPYETPAGSTMVLIQPYVIEKPSIASGNRTIAFPVPISLNTSNKNLEALSRG